MAAILQGNNNNNNNNFQQSLYVYIQEKHSYSGSKSREWALTHMQRKQHTHTQAEFQTHRHFYSFLIRFPRKCDECAKGFCRCRCLQHTHTQPEPAHTQTNWRAYMNACVCVCVEPPLAVSPTALLLLLLLPSLSCERASVFVDFGVYVGQQQQQQQQPNSGPWLRVYGARATFGRNSLKHTHTHVCLQAYSLIPTQTQSAHLLHFACALSRLLLLDAAATAICCCYCLFFALRSLSLQFAQIRISVAIFFCTSFCTCKLREHCVRE